MPGICKVNNNFVKNYDLKSKNINENYKQKA